MFWTLDKLGNKYERWTILFLYSLNQLAYISKTSLQQFHIALQILSLNKQWQKKTGTLKINNQLQFNQYDKDADNMDPNKVQKVR